MTFIDYIILITQATIKMIMPFLILGMVLSPIIYLYIKNEQKVNNVIKNKLNKFKKCIDNIFFE
jgi:type IV secretory pathway VirB3-like protein